MFAKKKITKNVAAAVDIGAHSIKILESVSELDSRKITRFVIKEIPAGTSHEAYSGILKSALDEATLSTKELRISLAGPDAIVRIINMPEMNPQDLKSSLRFEADRYIPFSVDEVNIDSFILGKTSDGGGQMRVLLAAAKKDLIKRRFDMFQELGFSVSLIDVNVFAVLNAFSVSVKDLKPEVSFALLNFGHKYTNIVICKGYSPYFTRDIQIGGEQISGLVSKKLGIDAKDVFDPKPEIRDANPLIDETIKGSLSKLVDEIRLSFGYYENQFGSSIEKVYVSGGFAKFAYLLTVMEENLGMKPIVWDTLSGFQIDDLIDKKKLDAYNPALAVVSGLAIRSVAQ